MRRRPPIGDTAESAGIIAAIGQHAAVYAPKSALGHSIGAVGALESVLTIKSVEEGVIPPTLNLENQDPECDIDVVHGEPRYGQIDYAINNSFGFGGHNVRSPSVTTESSASSPISAAPETNHARHPPWRRLR